MQCGDRNRMRTWLSLWTSTIDLLWSTRKMKKKDSNFNIRWCNSIFGLQWLSYLNCTIQHQFCYLRCVFFLPWNLTTVHLNLTLGKQFRKKEDVHTEASSVLKFFLSAVVFRHFFIIIIIFFFSVVLFRHDLPDSIYLMMEAFDWRIIFLHS